jgi:phage baseplate assembly protein W
MQVKNGDIVVNQGSLQFVTGSSKLAQDLSLWLREPLEGAPPIGIGFTTPSFGSLLYSYVGQANNNLAQAQIKSEILRILGIYQQNQLLKLQKAQTVAAVRNWNKSEIIQKVLSIDVVAQNYAAEITISIQTLANTTVPLNIILGQNGITVS